MEKVGEFLKSIRKTDALIKRKTEQLERLRSIAEYKSPVMDNIGGGKGGNNDIRGDTLCKIVDLEIYLKEQINELLEKREKAMLLIDTLDNADMINILYLRYLDYKSWQEISFEVGKTMQWVLELNRRALRKLENS